MTNKMIAVTQIFKQIGECTDNRQVGFFSLLDHNNEKLCLHMEKKAGNTVLD